MSKVELMKQMIDQEETQAEQSTRSLKDLPNQLAGMSDSMERMKDCLENIKKNMNGLQDGPKSLTSQNGEAQHQMEIILKAQSKAINRMQSDWVIQMEKRIGELLLGIHACRRILNQNASGVQTLHRQSNVQMALGISLLIFRLLNLMISGLQWFQTRNLFLASADNPALIQEYEKTRKTNEKWMRFYQSLDEGTREAIAGWWRTHE